MKTEKMQEIFQTILVDNISNCCGNSIEDIFEYLASIGFSKKEAFDFVDKNYVANINWQSDDEDDEEVNTETGEGVFWKEYTEDEDINIGDSDRAIIETALTQVGIPYTWEESNDGDGTGWIDLKIVDEGVPTESTAAEIYFTKTGKFKELY